MNGYYPDTGVRGSGVPAIAAADKSIETGKLEPVAKLVAQRMEDGLHKQFGAVATTKKYSPNDVAAARAYVGAYVEYVHYVERLYNAARKPGSGARSGNAGGGKGGARALSSRAGSAAPASLPAAPGQGGVPALLAR